jgi:hypothetical protein|uniref:Uncharacterized protein n=1 Tax=viral metagenome TaxID=1070528 RepID=A0A6C0AUB8_9ZZZZ
MKFDKTLCCILCGVIFIIIVGSLFAGSTYVPYSPNSLFTREYPYEGFGGMTTDYSSAASHNAMDSYKSYLIDSSQGGDCKKVHGFNGLFCSPGVADNKIDLFAGTEGKLSCSVGSSGLSNSKGSLCLTEQQKQLLSSRGGNQTGAPSSLG